MKEALFFPSARNTILQRNDQSICTVPRYCTWTNPKKDKSYNYQIIVPSDPRTTLKVTFCDGTFAEPSTERLSYIKFEVEEQVQCRMRNTDCWYDALMTWVSDNGPRVPPDYTILHVAVDYQEKDVDISSFDIRSKTWLGVFHSLTAHGPDGPTLQHECGTWSQKKSREVRRGGESGPSRTTTGRPDEGCLRCSWR